MKCLAIFLTLAFLTGFQAAVLSEEPPPSISEPNQSVLEQLKEQFGKFSAQVTQSVNDGLDTIKGTTSDALAYATELGKKYTPTKLSTRKFFYLNKDIQQYSQTLLNQGREAMNDQYKKIVGVVGEMKKHPAVTMVNEEVVEPFLNKAYKAAVWMGDQSFASLSTMVQKKFSF